jgi:SAM-dependent methyltransferase
MSPGTTDLACAAPVTRIAAPGVRPAAPARTRKRGRERACAKSWLTVRHIEAFVARHAHRLRGTGIDYGCGEMPYARLVSPHCARLLGADVEQGAHGRVDFVVGRGAPLPVRDASLDFALCTQVLEHVPDPGLVLRELARVLRPGGILLLTAPFVWEQHEEPHDYHRFTGYGIAELAARAALAVESLEPAGGMIEVLGQLVIHRLPSFGRIDWLLHAPLNLATAALDRLVPIAGITCNWQAVLRKSPT